MRGLGGVTIARPDGSSPGHAPQVVARTYGGRDRELSDQTAATRSFAWQQPPFADRVDFAAMVANG